MPVKINGKVYYRTKEACHKIGISRATLHRWINEGSIKNPPTRDRNGWRLFTEKEIDQIRIEASRITIEKPKQE